MGKGLLYYTLGVACVGAIVMAEAAGRDYLASILILCGLYCFLTGAWCFSKWGRV